MVKGTGLTGKTAQLSSLVSSFSSKAASCKLERLHKVTEWLLVEQPFLSKEGKPVQEASLCFECSQCQRQPTAVSNTDQQSVAACKENGERCAHWPLDLDLDCWTAPALFEN